MCWRAVKHQLINCSSIQCVYLRLCSNWTHSMSLCCSVFLYAITMEQWSWFWWNYIKYTEHTEAAKKQFSNRPNVEDPPCCSHAVFNNWAEFYGNLLVRRNTRHVTDCYEFCLVLSFFFVSSLSCFSVLLQMYKPLWWLPDDVEGLWKSVCCTIANCGFRNGCQNKNTS